jgi:translation initiation factor IF-2
VADDRARQLADQLGVQIRQYRIIYEIVDDVQKALEGLLAPEQKIELRGKAEVRQVFNVSKIGTIAGCYVVDGTIHRGHSVRLVRDGRLVVERAAIGSLKRFKDDAREVRAGLECGIKIAGFDDVKPGDVIESLEVVQIAQRL